MSKVYWKIWYVCVPLFHQLSSSGEGSIFRFGQAKNSTLFGQAKEFILFGQAKESTLLMADILVRAEVAF